MPTDSEKQKNIGDVFKSIAVGATSGAIATFVTFPTFVLKTRAQIGMGYTWRPSVLFLGSTPFAASSAGITALNVLGNDSIKRYYYGASTLNFQQSLVSSSVAGAGVAPIISWMEFSITLQQKVPVNQKAHNSFATLYNFSKTHGFGRSFIGMPAVAMRNTFISASFLSLAPFFKKQIQPTIKNDIPASIVAGMITGVFTSIFAYPLDTLRAKQQAGADGPSIKHLALRHLAKDVVRTQGVRGLYAGAPWYFFGLSSFITVLAYLNEKLPEIFDKNTPDAGASQSVQKPESKVIENQSAMQPRNPIGFFRVPKHFEPKTFSENFVNFPSRKF